MLSIVTPIVALIPYLTVLVLDGPLKTMHSSLWPLIFSNSPIESLWHTIPNRSSKDGEEREGQEEWEEGKDGDEGEGNR